MPRVLARSRFILWLFLALLVVIGKSSPGSSAQQSDITLIPAKLTVRWISEKRKITEGEEGTHSYRSYRAEDKEKEALEATFNLEVPDIQYWKEPEDIYSFAYVMGEVSGPEYLQVPRAKRVKLPKTRLVSYSGQINYASRSQQSMGLIMGRDCETTESREGAGQLSLDPYGSFQLQFMGEDKGSLQIVSGPLIVKGERRSTCEVPSSTVPIPAQQHTFSAVFPMMPTGSVMPGWQAKVERTPFGLRGIANFRGKEQGAEVTKTMVWELALNEPEIQAVLEPLNEAEYQDWIPGFVDAKQGSLIAFRCRLKDEKLKGLFTFRLPEAEVSKEPGRCLNYPPPDREDPEKYDLVFAARESQREEDATVGQGGLELTTKRERNAAIAVIEARDYGAFGRLRCTVVVGAGNSQKMEAKDPKTGLTFLPIPRDEDGNHIADSWQVLHGCLNKPPDADDEEEPRGDGHRGDGLTLYEEYRGFFEGGRHTRSDVDEPDPKKKDFYLRNLPGEATRAGIDLFGALSKLKVHRDLLEGEHRLRVVNFRSGFAHRVDQHAVIIMGISDIPDYTRKGRTHLYGAVGEPLLMGPPKNVQGITLPKDFSPRTVAHELFHACCVWHHGDGDLANVPFQHGVDRVFYENGKEAALPATFTKFERVGVWQGEHSGNQDCIMRYAATYYYKVAEHLYYHCDTEEVEGESLCTSPQGTGVNDKAHKPQPRYGDAAGGRGNCASQLCVNDAYDHPPRPARKTERKRT